MKLTQLVRPRVAPRPRTTTAAPPQPGPIGGRCAQREATVFTEAERAALALTEEGTPIAAIGAFNRLNVIVRNPAGCYEPGMLADIQR